MPSARELRNGKTKKRPLSSNLTTFVRMHATKGSISLLPLSVVCDFFDLRSRQVLMAPSRPVETKVGRLLEFSGWKEIEVTECCPCGRSMRVLRSQIEALASQAHNLRLISPTSLSSPSRESSVASQSPLAEVTHDDTRAKSMGTSSRRDVRFVGMTSSS